jgi:hypothetical protein
VKTSALTRGMEGIEAPRDIDLRVPGGLFGEVRQHVEDFSEGEQAGFLICGSASVPTGSLLLAREWIPIPPDEVRRDDRGYMLAWSASFNASVLDRSDQLRGSAVLVHSHGDSVRPRLSGPDLRNAGDLFSAFSRLLPGRPCGSVVLGDAAVSGVFWSDGVIVATLGTLHVVGVSLEKWRPEPQCLTGTRRRLDRQTRYRY